MKIKISLFYFRSSKECPGYRGFPAPKTKFPHVSMSLLYPSVMPWLVILCLNPVIHLSLGLPFFSSISFFLFFTWQSTSWHSLHASKLSYPLSSVTSNILLHASIVTLMLPFRNFCFRDLLVSPVKKSISFSSCLLACCFSKVCRYIYH